MADFGAAESIPDNFSNNGARKKNGERKQNIGNAIMNFLGRSDLIYF